MHYGLYILAPKLWKGEKAEFVVSGVNSVSNLWLAVRFSGTVGAAVYAVRKGIPAIAFSGSHMANLPWSTRLAPLKTSLYSELAMQFTNAVLASGKPYLPDNVWLNVNFPEAGDSCTKSSDFKWILTRINPRFPIFSTSDVKHCNFHTLPTESYVIAHDGCYISVSVGNAKDKTTANAKLQAAVVKKIGNLFSCLP